MALHLAIFLVLALHAAFREVAGLALYTMVFTAILLFATWGLGGFIAIALALFFLYKTIVIEAHDSGASQSSD